MENGETKMDCTISATNKFTRKFRGFLYISIFFTGVVSLSGVFLIPALLSEDHLWKGLGSQSVNSAIWEIMIFLVMILCFVSLIKIAVTKKPFSGVLVNCLYAIGILIVAGALIFPNLPSYQFPHYMIGIEGGPYIDGLPFTIGILILIFGKIVRYGLTYQNEIDMII